MDKRNKIINLKEVTKNLSVYQQIANKYGVSYNYVGDIARGVRVINSGKGLLIKKELLRLAKKNNQ